MRDWQSMAHVKWECKYHIIIIPKYRKKGFYGSFRCQLGGILRIFADRKVLSWWKERRWQTISICC